MSNETEAEKHQKQIAFAIQASAAMKGLEQMLPPGNYRLTFIARNLTEEAKSTLVSNDNITDLIHALVVMKAGGAMKG